MRGFFWKFVICLLPCILTAWITVDSVFKYLDGAPGGFKLGVDLVGGTILVYEIDFRKTLEEKQKEDKKGGKAEEEETSFSRARQTQVLAEALSRRIDPNQLKDIRIRPAGREGRVEIILPTGGTYRTAKAEKAWKELLEKMQTEVKKDYQIDVKLEVGRGKVQELADRIVQTVAVKVWEDKLFHSQDAWNNLVEKRMEEWSLPPREEEKIKFRLKQLWDVKTGANLTRFIDLVVKISAEVSGRVEDVDAISEKMMENWVKRQAWNTLLEKAKARWPFLKDPEEKNLREEEKIRNPLHRIAEDSHEQLATYILSGGNVIAQAGLVVLTPLLGNDPFQGTSAEKGDSYEEISNFINNHYGPSPQKILQRINQLNEGAGRSYLTVEDVQQTKDLVSKVGSLEFRILANWNDDKQAMEETMRLNNSVEAKTKLDELAAKGEPPLVPSEPFTIKLARDFQSEVRYAWVELGIQERRSLNLDNAAQNDPGRNHYWIQLYNQRNKAIKLKDPFGSGRELLQGALFFSRECKDRNLPAEEREAKKIEYFVLTRLPEINPLDPDKKNGPPIEGGYLSQAMSGQGSDLRPAVHFRFNAKGADLFGTITRKNVPTGSGSEESQIKRHLAIILDGRVMSAPTINSEIRESGQISGNFTQREVDELVNILRAGRLPATLKPQPVSESTMGATLGQDTIKAGVTAIGLAFMAVIFFMVVYYRFAGFVASIALMANLILTVGIMVAVQATFTLPGLAGLVLMLGMAVDANVLIYERLREERERGAALPLAIRNGYERAFPTIIDTHLSSIFTALVLYVVGNDQLKGFAISLTIGLIISLFTSLYMTRVMFDFWQVKNWLKKLSMAKLFSRPDIDFMGIRYPMFVITITIALMGISLFIGRLPHNLNIDFVGGTAFSGKLIEPRPLSKTTDSQGREVLGLRDFLERKDVLQDVQVEEIDETHYKIKFKSQEKPVEVALANKPDFYSPEERKDNIKDRIKKIDFSVEQLTPGFEAAGKNPPPPGFSRYFTVRTSEKEPELVQGILDELLREEKSPGKKESLMEKIYLTFESFDEKGQVILGTVDNKGTLLRFFAKPTPADFDPLKDLEKPEEEQWPRVFASPSIIKTIFKRELRKAMGITDPNKLLPVDFELLGEGRSQEGRYEKIRIKFDPILKDEDVPKVQQAVMATADAFNRPQPERLENFDSQLAAETRLRAMWAILASWGAILMYLWFRFGNWTFGLAAVICLIHDLFLTLGVIAACHYLHPTALGSLLRIEDFQLDLPAVAALLTLVGYSVNDTIVVFDRIREIRGKNPDLTPQMINDSVNATLSRTLLTAFTTWLVVFVLYAWGGPGVHLFAFVMVVGVIIGTYSSIYIASPLLLFFGEGTRSKARTLERPTASQPEPSPA